MALRDSTPTTPGHAESYISQLRVPRRRTRRAPKPRSVTGTPTPATLEKQHRILAWLREAPAGWTVAELGFLLGMSRQLALYHVKKLAATGQLLAELEPCVENGGLRFRVWDRTHRAIALAREVGLCVAA